MSRVLVIDDEPAICWTLKSALAELGHQLETCGSAEQALALAQRFRPEIVFLDVRLPGASGLSIMPELQQLPDQPLIVVMTAFGDLDTAVQAVRQGAFDYLAKPFDLAVVTSCAIRAESSLVSRRQSAQGPSAQPTSQPASRGARLLGRSPAMQAVFRQIAMVAETDISILITGETGTGKELVARAIHEHSSRANGPFVPICLAALPESVLESELFGHVRGAFTGAVDDRQGLIEHAAGGTLFLDEIGETSASIQVKLLRFLETRQFSRVGSTRLVPADVRVVAATNAALRPAMQQNQFREDLYYRLQGFEILLPSLRERAGDVELLAAAFWQQLALGRSEWELSSAFVQALQQRSWPGNVRELRAAITHAALLARGGPLCPEHLPPELTDSAGAAGLANWADAVEHWLATQPPADAAGAGELYRQFLSVIEPPLFSAVLARCQQSRTVAARWLGLDRTTLRTRLRQYGLEAAAGDGTTSG